MRSVYYYECIGGPKDGRFVARCPKGYQPAVLKISNGAIVRVFTVFDHPAPVQDEGGSPVPP